MQKEEIPIPYKVILKKLWNISKFGKLGRHQTRIILVKTFRVGKENVPGILDEMEDGGWIEKNRKFVILKIRLRDLV